MNIVITWPSRFTVSRMLSRHAGGVKSAQFDSGLTLRLSIAAARSCFMAA